MIQCKIYDIENDMYHGAILLDNGDAICGCCGGLLEASERGETWELVTEYDYWVNISQEILGE